MIRLSKAQAKQLLGTQQTVRPKKPPKQIEPVHLPDGRIQVGGHVYTLAGLKATCGECGLAMPESALPMWGTGMWRG